MQIISKLFSYFEVSKELILSAGYRFFVLIGGFITMLLVLFNFSPELQGFYYTFASFAALQVFAEMGLASVIITVISHEWAHLKINDNGVIKGNRKVLEKLFGLTDFAIRWFLVGSIAFFILTLIIGCYFFWNKAGMSGGVSWLLPWIAFVFVLSLNILLVPFWAILEGCNQLLSVYKFRITISVVANIAAWISIILGAGLWVCSINILMVVLISTYMIKKEYSIFFYQLYFRKNSVKKFTWIKEVLPLQWRITISWISGYLSFSLFVPVLFHYHGAVVAGQMGVTLSLIAALSSISASWMAVLAPKFGILIARGQYQELDTALYKSLTGIYLGSIALGTLIYLSVVFINYFDMPISKKFLTPNSTGLFIAATIMQIITLPFSTYLRAHKKEPMLGISVVSGIFIGCVVLFGASNWGVNEVAAGYLIVSILLCPISISIWYKKKLEWHGIK